MGQDLNLILTTSNELRCAIGVVSVEMSQNDSDYRFVCNLPEVLQDVPGGVRALHGVDNDDPVLSFYHDAVCQAISYSNMDIVKQSQDFLLVELPRMFIQLLVLVIFSTTFDLYMFIVFQGTNKNLYYLFQEIVLNSFLFLFFPELLEVECESNSCQN